jgi:hypothetical protein
MPLRALNYKSVDLLLLGRKLPFLNKSSNAAIVRPEDWSAMSKFMTKLRRVTKDLLIWLKNAP